jgi:PAS domain S-box-containing protein
MLTMLRRIKNRSELVSTDEKRLTYTLLLKTVAAITALFLVLLLAAGLYIDYRFSLQKRAEMHEQVDQIAETLETIMLDDVVYKMARAQAWFQRVGMDTLYTSLRIISLDSQIVFSKDRRELGRKLNPNAISDCRQCHSGAQEDPDQELIYISSNGVRTFHFVKPIHNHVQCEVCHIDNSPRRGTLVADFSLAQLDSGVRKTRMSHLQIFLTLLLIISVSVYFLLRFVAYRPLMAIAGRLKHIAAGDFSKDSSPRHADIMGFINSQIDQTAEQLEGLYEDLEAKVDDRTRSLRSSQAALIEERNKLRFIIDSSPQGFAGLTMSGDILFANRQMCSLLRVDHETLAGKSLADISPLKKVFEGEAVQTALNGGKVSSGQEQIGFDGDEQRFYEVHAASVSSKGDQALLLMLNDTTEKRLMQMSQERHERLAAIGQLGAAVAHEIGNPLAAISSLVQITQKVDDTEKQSHNLELINYHIDRIRRIVRNLTDFARVPDERMIPTDINEILRGAIEIASFDSRAKGIDISIDSPDDPIMLDVRRDQLVQALLNIVINAFDSMDNSPDPRLEISVQPHDKGGTISVSDNGTGIDDGALKHIFEPFFTTKPVGKGTGLGLSVTYRIIVDMGGDVAVKSKVGHGTTFTIRLPETRKISE